MPKKFQINEYSDKYKCELYMWQPSAPNVGFIFFYLLKKSHMLTNIIELVIIGHDALRHAGVVWASSFDPSQIVYVTLNTIDSVIIYYVG